MPKSEVSADAALFLSVFFDELVRYGVREVVVSPGSRSTPLAMVAFEASRRADLGLRLFIDVDERGAAFFALGMAKASGRPVCLICTSGTAAANYYPAVLEAEASRVPLVVLTGDRPPRLQGLGAPQTCDQLKLYGDHARFFQQMPLPTSDPAALAFARQVARQALISACGPSTCELAAGSAAYAAAGACGTGSPAHINFPFDDPLKPDLSIPELFTPGRSQVDCASAAPKTSQVDRPSATPQTSQVDCPSPHLRAPQRLAAAQVAQVRALLHQQRAIVLCGEGSCADAAQRHALLTWAHAAHLPLLADPLSGLRTCDDPLVIDNYDNIFAQSDCPPVDLFIRFGRYPISKRATTFLARTRPIQIVVDPVQTRDFNAATDLFIQMTPTDFVASLLASPPPAAAPTAPHPKQAAYAKGWISANDAQHTRIESVAALTSGFEGAFVHTLLDCLVPGSLLFSASSMAIRALDTFYAKRTKPLCVLCNRGLNGIDGTLSTALGAAQHFAHATFLTGDLTLLHDLPALALQQEMLDHQAKAGYPVPQIVVVLLNNQGGGIFDTLPQKSDEDYFERLFITPQTLDFAAIAAGFHIPHAAVETTAQLEQAYAQATAVPGISLIEIAVPLSGVAQRYAPYQ
ncbi:MAG: 2-succinyl-5-enolpyruvyl-6-hydroxy-3-cyclohexene-1-carboxylic-acid synthase [Raoultibacter sp.]